MARHADATCPLHDGTIDIPHDYMCPITGELLRVPVTLPTGKTYERAAIVEWFSYGSATCPLTRVEVVPEELDVNIALQTEIQAWLAVHVSEDTPLPTCSPLQAFDGHFILPAPADDSPAAPPSVLSLARALRVTRLPSERVSILHSLVTAVVESELAREEIAAAGAITTLIRLMLTADDTARWLSAEVLSYLSLDDSKRITITAALHNALPSGWLNESDLSGTARRLAAALGSRDAATQTAAAWALWVLSVWEYTRLMLVAMPEICKALVKALSSSACIGTRVAVARVLRSLAMLPRSLEVLDEEKAGPALCFLLQNGSELERVSAATALCNLAFSPDRERFSSKLTSKVVLATLAAMLRSGCPLQQRAAARLVKAVADLRGAAKGLEAAGVPAAVPALLTAHVVQHGVERSDRLVLEAAVGALHALACEGSAAAKARLAVEHGAAAALAPLLRASNTDLAVAAARALVALGKGGRGAALAMADPTVYSAALDALQTPNERLQYYAARMLLAASGTSAEVQLLHLDDPAPARALVQLLGSTAPSHAAVAAALLHVLATEEDNRPYIAKVGGVHALLDVVRGEYALNGARGDGSAAKEAACALTRLARAEPYFREEIRSACAAHRGLSRGLPADLLAED